MGDTGHRFVCTPDAFGIGSVTADLIQTELFTGGAFPRSSTQTNRADLGFEKLADWGHGVTSPMCFLMLLVRNL